MRKILLFYLLVILIASNCCFAERYIITPPEGDFSILSESIEKAEFECLPFLGLDTCLSELNETQVQLLKEAGYGVYLDFIVTTFLDTSIPQINVGAVWNEQEGGINLTGVGQTICIIDSGVDYNHTALGGGWGEKIIAGYMYLNDSSQNCSVNNSACYDDNGHGTHVAGIISSSDSTYKGVAPDAKLVIVRAMKDVDGNPGGIASGRIADVILGVTFCVNNKEKYNISVISMSLGAEDYRNSTYCDGVPILEPIRNAINNAIAADISVITASGNYGADDAIAAPACLYNSTPVGNVDSSDNIVDDNYWALPILFSPGVSITSVGLGGGFVDDSGTSMAAPHVAGVFALMRQYLELSGKDKSPQELEDLAVATGINVTETQNNSRIDSYELYLNISSEGEGIFESQSENVSNCGTLSTANTTYYLNKSVSSSGTCFTINASKVTLDCQGYTINYSQSSTGYGVNDSEGYDYLTLRNCNVLQEGSSTNSHGIYLANSAGLEFENNTVTTTGNSSYPLYIISSNSSQIYENSLSSSGYKSHGIYLSSSHLSDIEDNLVLLSGQNSCGLLFNITSSSNSVDNVTLTSTGISSNGLCFYSNSNSNSITSSVLIGEQGYGVYFGHIGLGIPNNNKIYNCLINGSSTPIGFSSSVGVNHWNTTKQLGIRVYTGGNQIGGNYYTNSTGNGFSDTCTDSNYDGFCDSTYAIPDGNVSVANTDYFPLSQNFVLIKVKPNWMDYTYFGNKVFKAGETETENTTRRLYYNLNQTKTLVFIINNTGSSTLSLSEFDSVLMTNPTSGKTINFSEISYTLSIPSGNYGYLNITLDPTPNNTYIGDYIGWIYLNSSESQPYNQLNLTLNITVVQTVLSRLNKTNNIYYFGSGGLTGISYLTYFFDNLTQAEQWSGSAVNLTLKNQTTNLKNVSFTYSSGTFSGQINNTNLAEANYTLFGSLSDQANNTADINLSFELLNNLENSIIGSFSNLIKGQPFSFGVNVSKDGLVMANNVTTCINLPTGISTSGSSCKNLGNINSVTSNSSSWTLNGTTRGTYDVSVSTYSYDGKYNKTTQTQMQIKYGNLVVSLKEAPSSVEKDEVFTVEVYVENTGTLTATNVTVKIRVDTTEKNTDCSEESISPGAKLSCESDDFSFSTTGDGKDIDVKIISASNTDYVSTWQEVEEIDIEAPSSSSNDFPEEEDFNYELSFERPILSSFNITAGENYTLTVEVENTGDTRVNDLYLDLKGISSNYYTLSPSSISDLLSGVSRIYTIFFSIPENITTGTYTLTLEANSDEVEEEKKITLYINEPEIEEEEEASGGIKLETQQNETTSGSEEIQEGDSLPLIMATAGFAIILSGIIIFYVFVPKKGYTPGKGYKIEGGKTNLGFNFKNPLKKIFSKKSEYELHRERKLREWERYYSEARKKRRY